MSVLLNATHDDTATVESSWLLQMAWHIIYNIVMANIVILNIVKRLFLQVMGSLT